ncbi:Nucleic acid-binding OB-fold [Penicillium chermesinum]|nr:Nucleic acid-binding OB-fold [Penicillium chermesinum]
MQSIPGSFPTDDQAEPSAPGLSGQDDKIETCINSLIDMGYGTVQDGGRARIAVYAAASNGVLLDAIEMIEDERKAYARHPGVLLVLVGTDMNFRSIGVRALIGPAHLRFSCPRSTPTTTATRFFTMQVWRRSFATGAARLSARNAPRIPILRCAQLLKSGKDGAASMEDQRVGINGIIRSVRKQKNIAFAEVFDGSIGKNVQVALKPNRAEDLTTGVAVHVEGTWKACPGKSSQSHELQAESLNFVGEADPTTFPIQKKYQSSEFLRQIPHLRMRTPFYSLLSRFRSECLFQLGNTFHSYPDGFTQVQPPIITSSDCEGAGETFTLAPRGTAVAADGSDNNFFRSPKYLTVSSQLHLESYAAELGNVWTLTPVFRAEKSDTPRHLSEFYMLEAEANFMYDLDALTDQVEHLVRDLTRRLYETPVGQEILAHGGETEPITGESHKDFEKRRADNVAHLHKRWETLMNGPRWHRITYSEAIAKLQEAALTGVSFEHVPIWDSGLQLEHEKYLVEKIFENSPVFVTDYPKAVKPFYMAPSAEETIATTTRTNTVACFDLLFPEVAEVAGGSLREHRLPNLIQNMREHGLIKKTPALDEDGHPSKHKKDKDVYPHLTADEDLGHLQWYADLRRWGSAPHGGFGLGFDRFLSYLSGVSSVRDVVAFPRYFRRADC